MEELETELIAQRNNLAGLLRTVTDRAVYIQLVQCYENTNRCIEILLSMKETK